MENNRMEARVTELEEQVAILKEKIASVHSDMLDLETKLTKPAPPATGGRRRFTRRRH